MRDKVADYMKDPKRVRHETYEFGCLDDGAIIFAYLVASCENKHLLYCAKECFHNGEIDEGCGSFVICKKKKTGIYSVLHKNKLHDKEWANVGDGCVGFVNRFVMQTSYLDENDTLRYSRKKVDTMCRKLDKKESVIAKQLKKEYDDKVRKMQWK